jgi:hypothetical protein
MNNDPNTPHQNGSQYNSNIHIININQHQEVGRHSLGCSGEAALPM